MIPAEWYSISYHISIATLVILFFMRFISYNKRNVGDYTINQQWCFIFLLVTILFIGLRDPYSSYFGDTETYTKRYNAIQYIELSDWGFYFLMKFCSYFLNVNLFYLLSAFLYIVPVYFTLKKWFANLAVYSLILYICTMSFWGFGINGVRNGLAVSFFIFALGFWQKKKIISLPLMLLAFLFHKSIALPVFVFFVTYWIKKTNILIIIWIISIFICFIFKDILSSFVTSLLDIFEGGAYVNELSIDVFESFGGKIAFRFDFVLYSSVSIILGWFYVRKKKFTDTFYLRLLNTYILTNTIWIIFFMYAMFTDRFAYLSWCIMPIVMIYPLLKEKIMTNQFRFITWLILGNLLFTLIMFFR